MKVKKSREEMVRNRMERVIADSERMLKNSSKDSIPRLSISKKDNNNNDKPETEEKTDFYNKRWENLSGNQKPLCE